MAFSSASSLFKVFLYRLLDSTDLIRCFPFKAHKKALRHRDNPQPIWKNARYTANKSFHRTLVYVYELTMKTNLEQLDYLCKVKNSNIFVDEELSHSFGHSSMLLELGHSSMLLELSLLCLAFEVLLIALLSQISELYYSTQKVLNIEILLL